VNKVLITGASSGIGRALARLLAERGVSLVIQGRNVEALGELLTEIGTKTPTQVCVADLSTFEGTQTLLGVLQKEFPDVVINCAGFGLYGDLTSHGPQEVQQMIAVNNAAVVAVCQHISYWWQKEAVEGTIMNVSSALGCIPSPGAAVYGGTKAFINSFSEALDVELQEKGIRVLTACPGRVATKFAARASKGKVEKLETGGSVLDPVDVAKAILTQIDEKKPFQVIDWRYRLLLFINRLLPKRFALKRLYSALKARANS